ncbi:chromosomal replication initiator protein DnaA [Candidatus Dependentiae bacterium]|nr:chromosomal replication initiator protein DnaA [Candidatus Dependentiae bacterium]
MQGIWEDFLTIIKEEAGSRVVETWFRAVSLHQWDALNKTVYLQAPNSFVKDWIKSNYIDMIQLHLKRLLHVEALKIVFLDARSAAVEQIQPAVALAPAVAMSAQTIAVKTAVATYDRKQAGHLNTHHIFETFVVGPSNSLAYAAARAVAENPGVTYNPLFIYGGSGLGKTHLLHAIGNHIKASAANAAVLYQTADRFVNEFINAIRFDKIHRFQAKYRDIDVLLIDDIQFIANKEQTQEAFFHIFNALYESSKQIIFSSDVYPQDMQGIAERLRSRLACGLITDIHAPSFETKMAIIKKKAEHSNEQLTDEVALFVASRPVNNIRELEGCLIRVMAFASLTKQPITLELAKKVLLWSHDGGNVAHGIDLEQVCKVVAAHFKFSVLELKSKNRNKELSFARQVALFLMKKVTDKSLRDIGFYLGKRDHSTVVHAVEKIEAHVKETPEFAHELKRIELSLKSART